MDSRTKWNAKYNDRLLEWEEPEPNPRLKALSKYLNGGTALDLACGLGGNSVLLAKHNYQVQAIDISDVAINHIQELALNKALTIQPRAADLTDFKQLQLKADDYDLVVIAYYLDRNLFPVVKKTVKENGYFFMETFYQSPQTENQGISTHYKLKPRELVSEFADWTIHYFEENEEKGRQTIFCQKC